MAPNAKFVKACKAMHNMGYKSKIVKPVLQELLELYENNWMLIEDDSYQVLVDAILDSEEQKARHDEFQRPNTWAEDKAEKIEPPLKKSKLSSQEKQSSTSCYASISNTSNEVENQPYGKQNLPDFIYEKHQDVDLMASCVKKYSHAKGKSSSSQLSLIAVQQAKKTNVVSDNESDKSYSLEPLAHLENSGGESDMHQDFPENRMITCERGSIPQLLEHVYSIGKKSDFEGNSSVPMDCEAEKNKNDAQESLKLDIASSSGGEVKISLMAKSKSDVHVPSLEALLKQVEEQCLKSYEPLQTDFSMSGLMKDVCESFLAAGTTSAYAEDVGPTDVSSLNMFKDTDETGAAKSIDHQLSLCSTISSNPVRIQNLFEGSPQILRPETAAAGIDHQLICSTISKDPVRVQNLLEVSPQIPRFYGSIVLDLSRCRIYLNVDLKSFPGMERNIMELNNYVPSSSRTMLVQKSYYHYVADITKGQEAYEISLINELNEEQCPAFHYVLKNMTYQNEYLRFLLSHVSGEDFCSIGDCLSLEVPCACASKTGFEFAYIPGCLLKENFLDNVILKNQSALQRNLFYCEDCPVERCKGNTLPCRCKGHIVRNFIKECWHKCGCGFNCGNRVVQRGITSKLQVFRTAEQKGWGLRTLEDIPKGAFICEYVGEVITSRVSFKRNMQNTGDKLTYHILLDADWSSKGVLKDGEALCIDATVYGNIARFINHRCFDANLVEIPVEVETPDHNYYHLALFTTRKVNAFEELTWDYGIDF